MAAFRLLNYSGPIVVYVHGVGFWEEWRFIYMPSRLLSPSLHCLPHHLLMLVLPLTTSFSNPERRFPYHFGRKSSLFVSFVALLWTDGVLFLWGSCI